MASCLYGLGQENRESDSGVLWNLDFNSRRALERHWRRFELVRGSATGGSVGHDRFPQADAGYGQNCPSSPADILAGIRPLPHGGGKHGIGMKELSYEEYQERVKDCILTDGGNCPVTSLLLMIQGKWKFQLIYELCIKDPVRFGELRKNIEGITNTMLTASLRELERDGLVSRVQFNEIPPHVEYDLTEKGRALLPVFYEMTKWGLRYIR